MAITSVNGVQYEIGQRLGKGGVAKVFRAKRLTDGKEFAFKTYAPQPDNPKVMAIHGRIKRNVKNLMAHPLLGKDGKPQVSFVHPVDCFDTLKNGSFGYIMPLVDTKKFLPLKKLWHPETYPDAKALCEAGKRLATFFDRIHARGYCYKDINEGNIYINPETGEVWIIDCDNINESDVTTILGTSGYIAPEVYETEKPNLNSDKFSLATYFYRLLVGGYPMDGSRSERYMLDNELNIQLAAKTIYGTDALFAFDPMDQSNTIRNIKKGYPEYQLEIWKTQTEYWDNLPQVLKDCFIQTFSIGLKRDKSGVRTTDGQWYDAFDSLLQTGLVKCKCGKHNFTSRKTCQFCDKKLPVVAPPPPPPSPSSKVRELTTVQFSVKRDVPGTLIATGKRKSELRGNQLHPSLSTDNLMRIQYNAKRNVLGALNLSNLTWIVTVNGKKIFCAPQERIVLEKGMVITVLQRKLQLTVIDVL